mgnify:CR=1 FL=1
MAEPEVPPAGLRFGTDGIRGRAGTRIVDPVVRALGRSAADLLDSDRVFLGRDTRESGPGLSRALAEGFAAGGLEVVQMGVVPTPAVAHAAALEGAAAAMVTASHNPWWDNGVKLFSAGGLKLDDAQQAAIQAAWDALPELEGSPGLEGWSDDPSTDAVHRWVDAVVGSVRPAALAGLAVVVDCANGATSAIAGPALERLGADVTVIHSEPDGRNINDACGSTQPAALQAAVTAIGADAGLAFDGDADRVFLVDEQARPVSGSTTTALVASGVLRREPGATVLHNLICSKAVPEVIAECGGRAVRTRVGHSIIKQAMVEEGAVFAGEHSGHYYFRDNYRADSGLIAALVVLEALSASDLPLSGLLAPFDRYAASGEMNTTVADPAAVIEFVAGHYPDEAQDRLDGLTVDFGDWWFNLRPSNTEPLLRLNVEAADDDACAARAAEVQALIDQ